MKYVSLNVLVFSLLSINGLMLYTEIAYSAQQESKVSEESTDTVTGAACYTYGDNETPAQAKRAATSLAQEQAVRGHRVFVKSESKVKNFRLEEDIIHTASSAMLNNIQIKKEEKKGQEICVTISATISPVSMDEMIRQRVNAKEISEIAQSPLVAQSEFGVRVWTNNANGSTGSFAEGDRLIVYVETDRDAYLKLDYFQADGTVVHMVPNKLRGQVLIKAHQVYSFGSDKDPEQFTIQPPFGAETIKAIFSTSPFDRELNEAADVGDSRGYLKTLTKKRGLLVKAAEHAVSVNTVSKAVEEYKNDRTPKPKN